MNVSFEIIGKMKAAPLPNVKLMSSAGAELNLMYQHMHPFCPACGTVTPDDALFCPVCGTRLAGKNDTLLTDEAKAKMSVNG